MPCGACGFQAYKGDEHLTYALSRLWHLYLCLLTIGNRWPFYIWEIIYVELLHITTSLTFFSNAPTNQTPRGAGLLRRSSNIDNIAEEEEGGGASSHKEQEEEEDEVGVSYREDDIDEVMDSVGDGNKVPWGSSHMIPCMLTLDPYSTFPLDGCDNFLMSSDNFQWSFIHEILSRACFFVLAHKCI